MKLENAFKKLTKEGFSLVDKIGNNTWAFSKPEHFYRITLRTSMMGIERQVVTITACHIGHLEDESRSIFPNINQAIKHIDWSIKYANAA